MEPVKLRDSAVETQEESNRSKRRERRKALCFLSLLATCVGVTSCASQIPPQQEKIEPRKRSGMARHGESVRMADTDNWEENGGGAELKRLKGENPNIEIRNLVATLSELRAREKRTRNARAQNHASTLQRFNNLTIRSLRGFRERRTRRSSCFFAPDNSPAF
jgi:hypothetical protein